jgi:branched-chain amino acid aminotransferase
MWAEWVWLNGRLVRGAEATVSVFDRSFMLGDGLFETLRVIDGRLFRLGRHMTRLERSAARLRLSLPAAPDKLTEAIRETLEANRLEDAAVRLTVSRGVGPPGPGVEGADAPLCVIAARAFHGYPGHWYDRGATAIISSVTKNERSPLSGLKTTSFGEHVLARAEAAERGVEEALLLNTQGHLVEGSSTNLFAVIAGRIHTPDLASGCLPGVTREAMIQLAKANGLEVREEVLLPPALATADEAFLTNSLLDAAPLASVEGRVIGSGCPGPITRLLADRYRELVEREAAEEALDVGH